MEIFPNCCNLYSVITSPFCQLLFSVGQVVWQIIDVTLWPPPRVIRHDNIYAHHLLCTLWNRCSVFGFCSVFSVRFGFQIYRTVRCSVRFWKWVFGRTVSLFTFTFSIDPQSTLLAIESAQYELVRSWESSTVETHYTIIALNCLPFSMNKLSLTTLEMLNMMQ